MEGYVSKITNHSRINFVKLLLLIRSWKNKMGGDTYFFRIYNSCNLFSRIMSLVYQVLFNNLQATKQLIN